MDANVLANLTSTFGGNPNAEEARGERCSPEEPL
jgi:hypothetical protein